MKKRDITSKENIRKCICIMLLLVCAVLSISVFSKTATSPETYKATIQSIDEKKATVMGVTATAAATSTALALIPGDATTPIANQIMTLSSHLLIVVCALVLEKSLLTVMGGLAFNVFVPLSCILMGIYTFIRKRNVLMLALKFIVLAVFIVALIPSSMKISDMVYEANRTTVEQLESDLSDGTANENEEKSFADKIFNGIKQGASAAEEEAKKVLNKFIDAIALFIIAYCVLPIGIILCAAWFIKFLFTSNASKNDTKKINKDVTTEKVEENKLIGV